MRRIVLAVMAVVMMNISAMAQNDERKPVFNKDNSGMVERRTQRVVDALGLDKDQAAKLLELNKKYEGKIGGHSNRMLHFGPGPALPPDSMRRALPDSLASNYHGYGMHGKGHCGNVPDSCAMGCGKPDEGCGKCGKGCRGDEMKENREAYNLELKKILTAKQYEQYLIYETKNYKTDPVVNKKR